MQKIKSFKAACKAKGYDPEKVLPDVSGMPAHLQKNIIAHAKLVVIAEALNGDWKPDWSDDDQYKYYPWFYMASSVFQYYGCDTYYFRSSHVGSRLCFRSAELAEYAGKQFVDVYRDFMTL